MYDSVTLLQGNMEILGVVIMWVNGSELDFGSAQVIIPNGVSEGTKTSRGRPFSVYELFRDTKP